MAQQRSDGTPYGAFNFQLTSDMIGNASPGLPQAGFQEISGLGMEVTEAEYRIGNAKVNHVRKISGLYKATDVTLKRGVIGFTDLFDWINQVRLGNQVGQSHTVTINLMDETGNTPVMTWTLSGAKPKSYKGATLNAKGGTDVALEELVLSVESIDAS
jgi:phage tail-like protein